MNIVSMSNLLEAGVHFGHQTKRWNPKMKEFIYTSRDDIYIIDLQKTQKCMEIAYEKIREIAENGGSFIFVGTKKQAQDASRDEAIRSESFYVTERWLGGTLTNFRTIRRRIKRLEEIETMEKEGVFEVLPKKEVVGIKKEYEKLNKLLCGIRKMDKLPNAMIITDPKKEYSAIREARKLNIPVFGIVDTNCDPDDVDYVIPGNDDAVRSVKVVLGVLNNAICEAKGLELVDYVTEEEKSKKSVIKEETKEKDEIKKESKEKAVKEEISENKVDTKTTKDYSKMTLVELKTIAKEQGIKGYSTMKKAELIENLEK